MSMSSLKMKKWEVKVSTTVEKARADQIWPLFQDFFGLNKWFPGLATCHGIQGINGKPGCIRYCAGFGLPPEKSNEMSWSKERLVDIDSEKMTFSYEIVDCNIGFKSYLATVRLFSSEDAGCVVEWHVRLDPVVGWVFEDLVKKFEVGLKFMIDKMEAKIISS